MNEPKNVCVHIEFEYVIYSIENDLMIYVTYKIIDTNQYAMKTHIQQCNVMKRDHNVSLLEHKEHIWSLWNLKAQN